MMDYLEHKLGGGRVKPQKQFLSNDRKVLLFNVIADNPYIIHYYLADDTIDIREVNFPNNGRDPFPLMLKRYQNKCVIMAKVETAQEVLSESTWTSVLGGPHHS